MVDDEWASDRKVLLPGESLFAKDSLTTATPSRRRASSGVNRRPHTNGIPSVSTNRGRTMPAEVVGSGIPIHHCGNRGDPNVVWESAVLFFFTNGGSLRLRPNAEATIEAHASEFRGRVPQRLRWNQIAA
jgi:hypothetical protein